MHMHGRHLTLLTLLWIAMAACSSEPSSTTSGPILADPSPQPMGPQPGTDPAAPSGGAGAEAQDSATAPADAADMQAPSETAEMAPDDAQTDDMAEPPAEDAPDPGPVDLGAPGPYEVVVERNVGESFRNTGVTDDTARCESFIGGTDADAETAESLTSYPEDMDRQLYTMFRPDVFQEGKLYPAITWGNGTCSHPFHFEEILGHLASHGFVIIATNTRWTGGGVEMLNGIDFILAENDNPDSVLFGKIDTEMLGATGHSQGSGATVSAGADPRIVATVPIQGASARAVGRLNGPTFLIAGELDDLVTPRSVMSAFDAATVPAVYGLSKGQDHLMPGRNPGPILDAVTAWFKIHLEDDAEARALFYGDDCSLCNDDRWELTRRNL